MSEKREIKAVAKAIPAASYDTLLAGAVRLIEQARHTSARAVNVVMTAVYWEIGRRIVEFEQGGERRAEYGAAVIRRLAADLTKKCGRGFGEVNLSQMKKFYLLWPAARILQTASEEFPARTRRSDLGMIFQTPSEKSSLAGLSARFPLPWSAYVRLLSVKNEHARRFYEEEALRNGWAVRQLDRQIDSLFYERTALSRDKAAMLRKGGRSKPGDAITPEEEIKDPYVLEFLGLRDEYSESDLEEALILHLERFLLELGGDFTFIGRQRRLRVGDAWYRLDLLFFHRRLRCLVLIDLKTGRFTHADAGQMHLYLNYAREHWTNPGENPPVGLILCAQKDEAVARYALDGLQNKVMAAEYRTVLPDEKRIAEEMERTRRRLENRSARRGTGHQEDRTLTRIASHYFPGRQPSRTRM